MPRYSPNNILDIQEKHISLLERTRKSLHANPELSGKEFNTQKLILDFLNKHCKTNAVKVGKTGVLAQFSGTSKGNNVMIRGDIDALPISEINSFEHKSLIEGVSHKCGHDGHTVILLGLAIKLSELPIEKGSVYLLFQPSEENGKGAQLVQDDPYFQSLKIDFAFALHNLPGFPLNEVVIKEVEFTSNVKSVVVKLQGKTAHAAEPEQGYNPSLAIANLLLYVDERTNNDPNSKDFFLITPVHVSMGEVAYGVSAGYGEVHLTIRSWSAILMNEECVRLEEFIDKVCLDQKLTSEVNYLEEFYSNNNDRVAVSMIRSAAEKLQLRTQEVATPFKWGEDFGLFTQRYKGAMFGLGAGVNIPALHNPDYDFPDEITATGVNLFYNIILKALQS